MTSLPEGEDAGRGRQHLFKHKYLWYLAKRQETIWKTTEKAKIPIYMSLWVQGSSLVKGLKFLEVFTLYKNFKVIISVTFGFIGSNIGMWKHLEFEKHNVPSNATSAFLCCNQRIISVKRWASPILNSIAPLSTALPMKPVYRQLKLTSPSRISAKMWAPTSARNKPS